MNLKTGLVVLLAICSGFSTLQAKEIKRLITEKDKVSYSIGLNIGKSFQQQSIDINVAALMKGVEDAIKGSGQLLTDAEIREVMTTFQKRMMAKKENQDKEKAGKNLTEGKAFLEKNKTRKGVTTLPSGLQYEVMRQGKGAKPTLTDTVMTNYKGTLISGQEFDSSYKRGKPTTFPVNGVIKGWTEALQLMKTGAKWKLYVPSDLAYGPRSTGPTIGPNSTLIFEIELVEIKSK